MKQKKIDAVEVWKELEDELAPRLGLSVIDRAVYLHLLRHSRFEGKLRLRFSILGIAAKIGLTGGPVREAVRRLIEKGLVRLIERSNIGHLVEVRLPWEIRAPRGGRNGAGGTFASRSSKLGTSGANRAKVHGGVKLDEADFLRTRALRQAIHAREGGLCFYCLRRTPIRSHCLDHVVPLVESGRNTYRNLVSCCMECNSDKRGHTAEDFLRRLYREGRLSAGDLAGRLRALKALAAGKLRPKVSSEEKEKSRQDAGATK